MGVSGFTALPLVSKVEVFLSLGSYLNGVGSNANADLEVSVWFVVDLSEFFLVGLNSLGSGRGLRIN